MSWHKRLRSVYVRFAVGLAAVGCLIALVGILSSVVHTDAFLGADAALVVDPAEQETSAPAVDTTHVPDLHTSRTQAIERAVQQLALLQDDSALVPLSDDIILDEDLLASQINDLHDLALGDAFATCVWCPDLVPTGTPEQLFAYGGPMGVPWIFGGGGGSRGGGSSGGGSAGSGGMGGGGAVGSGGSSQASGFNSSQSNGSPSNGGGAGNGAPGDNATDKRNDATQGNDSPGNGGPVDTWLPPVDYPSHNGGVNTHNGGVDTPGLNGQPVSVPEPSVLLLTALGVASLAGTRRLTRRLR